MAEHNDDLRELITRGFEEVKSSIAEIKADIKAHNQTLAEQDKELARCKDRQETQNRQLEKHDAELRCNHDEMLRFQTVQAEKERRKLLINILIPVGVTILLFIIAHFWVVPAFTIILF
jgi:chromosome segregation ATPase